MQQIVVIQFVRELSRLVKRVFLDSVKELLQTSKIDSNHLLTVRLSGDDLEVVVFLVGEPVFHHFEVFSEVLQIESPPFDNDLLQHCAECDFEDDVLVICWEGSTVSIAGLRAAQEVELLLVATHLAV